MAPRRAPGTGRPPASPSKGLGRTTREPAGQPRLTETRPAAPGIWRRGDTPAGAAFLRAVRRHEHTQGRRASSRGGAATRPGVTDTDAALLSPAGESLSESPRAPQKPCPSNTPPAGGCCPHARCPCCKAAFPQRCHPETRSYVCLLLILLLDPSKGWIMCSRNGCRRRREGAGVSAELYLAPASPVSWVSQCFPGLSRLSKDAAGLPAPFLPSTVIFNSFSHEDTK